MRANAAGLAQNHLNRLLKKQNKITVNTQPFAADCLKRAKILSLKKAIACHFYNSRTCLQLLKLSRFLKHLQKQKSGSGRMMFLLLKELLIFLKKISVK